MNKELLEHFKDICDDFSPYNHLPTDLYKGKIIGGERIFTTKKVITIRKE